MKRLTFALFLVILLLALASCKIAGVSSTETTSSSPTSAINTECDNKITPIPQQPMVSVSLPIVTETEYAQDGTIIFVQTYQNISAVLPDPNVGDAIILDYLNRIDNTKDTAQSILDAATKGYKQGNYWQPYTSEILYQPMRVDRGVISLFGNQVNYAGSAHPESNYQSVSYDLSTGDTLSLSDIIINNADHSNVVNAILSSLSKEAKNYSLYPDYEDVVKQRFNQDFLSDNDWYFNREGICFFFSPYEIAPYSSGVISVTVSYADLHGILEDAYFPDERLSAVGELTVKNFSRAPVEKFTQISEIVLQEQSEKFFLYTDGSVYDLQIACADEKDSTYHTVYAAQCLTSGDAVMVETDIKTPLRISYLSNETTVYKYLHLENDSYILTDEKGA